MFHKFSKKLKGSSLLKEMFIYTGTNFFIKLFPFLLLPLLTHSLTLDGFGSYSIYKVTINFSIPITGLCMSSVLIRRYYDKNEIDFDKYLSTILIGLLVNVFFVVIIASGLSTYVKGLLGITFDIFLVSLLVSFCTCLITISQGILRCMNKPFIYATFSILQALAFFIGIVLYNHISNSNLMGFILVELLINVIFTVIGLLYMSKNFNLNLTFNWLYMKDAIKFVSPIIPYSLMAYAFAISDRYIIGSYLGNEPVALYSAAFQIASILQVLAVSFNAVWTPWVFNYLKSKGDMKRLYKKQILISLAFLVVAILFAVIGPFLVLKFLGQKYESSLVLFKWFVLANLIQAIYWVINPILTFYERNKLLLYASCIAVFVSVLLNLSFIKRFGVEFVAAVNSLSWFIALIVIIYFTYRTIKNEYAK